MCSQGFSINKITPLVPGKIMTRERLYSVFDQAHPASAFWISGPGGSGKSTLIASYLKLRSIPCLWYQVDAFDTDPSNFFYYLSLAAEPFIDPELQPLPPLTPEYLLNVDTYITRYFETLFQRLTSECWIVFDNFQDAPDNSPVQQIVTKAIGMLPRHLTLAIASRNDPPLAMARFRANRTMTHIDSNQITFLKDESCELIKFSGYQLSEKETDKIFQLTHGWVAGIILWLLHSENQTGSRSFPTDATPESIFDYFASEIFDKVDPVLTQFLLKTALFPYMTSGMAKQLTRLPAEKILDDLNRRNCFLEKRYLPTASFQYHPLFREFLLTRAKHTFSPIALKELYSLAAAILIKNDLIEDGVDLYVEAEEYELLSSIILTQAPVLASQGRHQVLASWISLLPPIYSEKNPWLLFWKGISLLPSRPPKGQTLCIQSYELFLEDNDLTGQIISWSMIVELYLLLRGNFTPLDHWIAEGERLAELLPGEMDRATYGRFASSMLIALLLRKPGHAGIGKWQDRCEELLEACEDDQLLLSLAGNLSLSYQWFGQAAQAKGMLSVLKPLTNPTRVLPIIRIGSNAMISGLLLATGDWQGCRKYADEGLAISKETGIHVYDFLLLCSEVYLQLLTGNLAMAERFLDEMKNIRMNHATWDNGHYHFLIAWLTMQKGELDRSNIHIEKCLKMTVDCGNPFTIALSTLLKAQLLLERYEISKAQTVLTELVESKLEHNSNHINFAVNLVRADCAYCENKEEQTLEHLTTAFSLAEQHGIIVPVGLDHNRLSMLCVKALAANIHKETVTKFIKLVRLLPPSSMGIEPWPWPVQIYTLGTMVIKTYGEPLILSTKTPKKPLELLRFLICNPRWKNSKETIAEHLWPEIDGDRAIQSFNITLHRLRKILGQKNAVVMKRGKLFLNPELCWVDSWYFEELAQLAETTDDSKEEAMKKALSLYVGPIDHGYNTKIKRYSEKLNNKWVILVGKLAQKMADTNRQEQALKLLEQALLQDNTAEHLYQIHMTIRDRTNTPGNDCL